jgi:hypothetical protein
LILDIGGTSGIIDGVNELDKLGARHKKLLAEIEELKPKLHEAMRTERSRLGPDGKRLVSQREIMERSGYKTIKQVREITGEAGAASAC